MVELNEHDIKVVANARWWRKWRWRMVATMVPPLIIFALCWLKWVIYNPSPSLAVEIGIIIGFWGTPFGLAICWDRKQHKAAKEFVEEWRASKNV